MVSNGMKNWCRSPKLTKFVTCIQRKDNDFAMPWWMQNSSLSQRPSKEKNLKCGDGSMLAVNAQMKHLLEAKNLASDNLLHTLNNECLKSEMLCVFSLCFEGWGQGISDCPLLESWKRLQLKTLSFLDNSACSTSYKITCFSAYVWKIPSVLWTMQLRELSHTFLLCLYSVLCIAVAVKGYFKM